MTDDQFVPGEVKFAQLFTNDRLVDTEIEHQAKKHVAGDAGKGVEIEGLHLKSLLYG